MSATPQEGARTVSGLTGPTEAVGETESETREFDIGAIFPPLGTHVLRTRYVDLAPGGTVRIHSHVHRPSFYLVVEGELEVHRSDRLEGERLRAGDTTQAVEGAAPWWRNPTGSPARLFVADLRPKAGHASGPDGARVREDAAAHAGAHPDPAGLRDPLPDLPQASLAGFSGPVQDIDEVNILIAEVPLAAEFPDAKGINGLWMRARWLDIGPHGVVPLHDHRHRPNFMRVMHGTLTFHGPAGRQDYAAGSVVLEAGPEPHWWENRGGKPSASTRSTSMTGARTTRWQAGASSRRLPSLACGRRASSAFPARFSTRGLPRRSPPTAPGGSRPRTPTEMSASAKV